MSPKGVAVRHSFWKVVRYAAIVDIPSSVRMLVYMEVASQVQTLQLGCSLPNFLSWVSTLAEFCTYVGMNWVRCCSFESK